MGTFGGFEVGSLSTEFSLSEAVSLTEPQVGAINYSWGAGFDYETSVVETHSLLAVSFGEGEYFPRTQPRTELKTIAAEDRAPEADGPDGPRRRSTRTCWQSLGG